MTQNNQDMVRHGIVRTLTLTVVMFALIFSLSSSFAQKNGANAVNPPALVTRTATRQETRRLGYGGTVTIVGAPQGSITIEGWSRSEVSVTANIEVKAESEEDLNRLAAVNGFVVDDEVNHVRVLSVGTHDKAFMRRAAKSFPKKLIGLPWKIDYRIRVPEVIDLEINAGRGPISLKGIEGAIRLSATESETEMTLTGGTVSATVASGKVRLAIPARSWRGAGADVRLASGDLVVEVPAGFSGDIDAEVLRVGRIENSFKELESREKPGITERVIKGRAGAGGAVFRFTVGDGTISLRKIN